MPRPRNKRPPSVEILQDADGRWEAFKVVGKKPNGRPDRRHRRGATYEEVAEKIRHLEDEVAAGTLGKAGRKRYTVREWYTTWLTDIAPHQPSGSKREPLRPKTLQDYWGFCRNWVFPHLGELWLDELDTDDLDRLYTAMYKARKSAKTVHNVHSMIRRGLAVAEQRDKVKRNVAALMDDPGAPSKKKGKALSEEQAKRILAAIERRRNALRWKVGLAIGPRQGEAVAVRWQCIDWDEGAVDTSWQIQRRPWRHGCDDVYACGTRPRHHRTCENPTDCRGSRCRPDGLHRKGRPRCSGKGALHDRYHRRGKDCPPPVTACPRDCAEHARRCPKKEVDLREGEIQLSGGLVLCRPKTYRDQADQHLVALPRALTEELRVHRRDQAKERLAAGELWEDHDLVFCQSNGRPIDPRADYEEWQEILREAGLEGEGTHIARATAATMLLEMGVDIAIVQQVLGHSQISTTLGYTTVSVGLTRRAADRMDALFTDSATDLATRRARRRTG